MEINIHMWLQDDIVRFLTEYARFEQKMPFAHFEVEVSKYGTIKVYGPDWEYEYKREYKPAEALALYLAHKGVVDEVR